MQRGHLTRDLLLHHRAECARVDARSAAKGGKIARQAACEGVDLAHESRLHRVEALGDRALHLVDAAEDHALAPDRVAILLAARVVHVVDRLLQLFEPLFQVLLVLRGDQPCPRKYALAHRNALQNEINGTGEPAL